MRITTGIYKGRNIGVPKGIRPTQDKVRKALFDILGDVEGESFLELFAGSGGVGFEALSRGARELVLVEQNQDCLLAIRKNIDSLAAKSCITYPLEAEKAIAALHKDGRRFDIIFLDPPYYKDMAKKILQMLGPYDILAPDGFVVVQHFKKDSLPVENEGLVLVKEAGYGDTFLSFYRRQKKYVPDSRLSGDI
ncbi:MAG TPA: 16S rRNA (guanine(966)-N(2))-methyltransferase RsmD [Candidatus Margulisiibacteriota bacterium]|nr:16S rRNA (guanine(966)-N(2))-methyltransferase RsmD [Candidatus Margulisiibacteriota bacterium]